MKSLLRFLTRPRKPTPRDLSRDKKYSKTVQQALALLIKVK